LDHAQQFALRLQVFLHLEFNQKTTIVIAKEGQKAPCRNEPSGSNIDSRLKSYGRR
jgi:hypothetical protein